MSPDSAARVLLADDNEANRDVALSILHRVGLEADAVVNGREAVDAVCSNHYTVVLMDLRMPEMDGFEAANEIHRRLTPGQWPAIIGMTANELEEDRCVAAGMDDYVSKPIRPEELHQALGRWI